MIDPKFIVKLKGKEYPLWGGILNAATEAGLQSLTVRIIQIPTPENGNLAVVMARAEFEDGRVFEDVGDCSPQSTSPQLVAASLRLASTRAKGRVCRDAVNVGQTMFEELPGNDREVGEERQSEPPPAILCWEDGCGRELTRDELLASKKYAGEFESHDFCAVHGRELLMIKRAGQSATT